MRKRSIRAQALALKDGAEKAFLISCYLMQDYHFTVRLIERDTDTVRYDHTEYRISIALFYDGEGKVSYVFSVNDGTNTFKPDFLRFTNEPVSTPTPVPTATPVPYNQTFTFTRQWQGDHEGSLDWATYSEDGSRRHKLFNKTIVSETEWRYEAWFPAGEDIANSCIPEIVPDGCTVRYVNVGIHADATDRCYNGGTVINYKVPKHRIHSSLPVHHGGRRGPDPVNCGVAEPEEKQEKRGRRFRVSAPPGEMIYLCLGENHEMAAV